LVGQDGFQGKLWFVFQSIKKEDNVLPNEKRMHFFIKNEPASVFQTNLFDFLTGKNSEVNLKVVFCFFQDQKMTPLETFLLSERLRKQNAPCGQPFALSVGGSLRTTIVFEEAILIWD
jgi:hypothetical protein